MNTRQAPELVGERPIGEDLARPSPSPAAASV